MYGIIQYPPRCRKMTKPQSPHTTHHTPPTHESQPEILYEVQHVIYSMRPTCNSELLFPSPRSQSAIAACRQKISPFKYSIYSYIQCAVQHPWYDTDTQQMAVFFWGSEFTVWQLKFKAFKSRLLWKRPTPTIYRSSFCEGMSDSDRLIWLDKEDP